MAFDITKYLSENKIELGSIKKEVGTNISKSGHNDLRRTTYDVKIKDGKFDLSTHTSIMTESKKLNESSLSSGVESEMEKLLAKIKSGDGIDPRAMKSNTDGELLAMVILPILQGIRIKLKDMKGFSKTLKGRI
jgi:hypothetical protein